MAVLPSAVKLTIGIAPFLDELRTCWKATITALVGFKAENYGTCSRLDHDELKWLARYDSRPLFSDPNKVIPRVESGFPMTGRGQPLEIRMVHRK
jgi:hypothetical protein